MHHLSEQAWELQNGEVGVSVDLMENLIALFFRLFTTLAPEVWTCPLGYLNQVDFKCSYKIVVSLKNRFSFVIVGKTLFV